MELRVEALAARVGLTVDTVRFYQSRGLLPPPRREGRVALYDELHLERLRRIRALRERGFRLDQIGALLGREKRRQRSERDGPLLEALARERVGGERTLSRTELAAEAGVPEALVQAAERSGLVEPLRAGGEERFSESDLAMARAAFALLEAGLPLGELLELATEHARNVGSVCERAVRLFDEHVREPRRADAAAASGSAPEGDESEPVSHAFRTLLPQVTRLVALHFQRTLVSRALERLERRGDAEELREALAAAESSKLEVSWR